ncbi:hypothetical protein BMS3Bbin08_01749 [bacterium BMS3Bbin08]|nr:hypothetical protein BMS3Bbin08_01749 [bacterium BMS3Bbin08]
MAKKLLSGKKLEERANELGVSLHEVYTGRGHLVEPELQRRVMEVERSQREARLWLIALISAIASVLSAAAAWYAIVIISP